jgi:hypothetical protein
MGKQRTSGAERSGGVYLNLVESGSASSSASYTAMQRSGEAPADNPPPLPLSRRCLSNSSVGK